jgi:DNA-binding CsgD family transcriptional regulator/energy-coupling factor transporter ATP-binding protein EcfA2
MLTMHQSTSSVPRPHAPHLWERQARPVLEAIAAASDLEPTRVVVVGNAGSGKSTMLRELHRILADRTAVSLLTDAIDPAGVPSSHILLVDDLHLLSAAQVDALVARSEDPDASLVVASRPFPRREELAAITRSLERSRPAIVLGHVSRSDVLTYLGGRDRAISGPCVDHILEFTGGVSWLACEALALHDDRDCADDSTHRALRRDVEERVVHRLDTIPPSLRHAIEALCVVDPGHGLARTDEDDVSVQGYAEGLLAPSGHPVPLVRAAVRHTLPARRLIDLSASIADCIAHSTDDGTGALDWLGVHDSTMSSALVEQADRLLERDPRRALALYDAALECGADEADLAGRRAQSAWASGRPEVVGEILEITSRTPASRDAQRVVDASAALWSQRGMMRMSEASYLAVPPVSPESHTRAAIAAVGVGTPPSWEHPSAGGLPSTTRVAMDLLDRGLRGTLSPAGVESAVGDLVRASDMYTSAGSSAPTPELPAVIAAAAAIGVGDLDTADTIIRSAIHGGQAGEWARTRLLLWEAWIAVQRSRPLEARAALDHAVQTAPSLPAREEFLAQAVRVSITRRYEDVALLEARWKEAADSIRHIEVDLYLLLPLTELVTASARVGDTARLDPHFTRALEIVQSLGAPPVWSVHLNWAGIQRGILINRPDELTPHARALVAASHHSPIAAVMAQAGRVWTSTLAGSVDPDAVEAAAHGLSAAGLAWDGARLAGHGASRSSDRKVSARLLSCARELHPIESVRRSADSEEEDAASAPEGSALSERERDVARLVLQGKTYAEIGQTIFISPRTAEHHIAHIRRRLGATSRSDLIAKLRIVVEQAG